MTSLDVMWTNRLPVSMMLPDVICTICVNPCAFLWLLKQTGTHPSLPKQVLDLMHFFTLQHIHVHP